MNTLIYMAIIEALAFLTPLLVASGLDGIALLGFQVVFMGLLAIAVYDAHRRAFLWQVGYALAMVWYLARTAAYVESIAPLADMDAGFPYLLLSAEVLLIVPLTLLALPFWAVYRARQA